MENQETYRTAKAVRIYKEHGGAMRTRDAIREGIHPEVIYRLRDNGTLEKMAPGLYRIKNGPELGNSDLVTVAMRIPKGVVCMFSALSYHNITTQIPHAVDVALIRGAEKPRLDYPPIQVYWAIDRIFMCGIEEHVLDGISVRIYSPEKTLIDCFRYRNKIGIDVAIEAFRLYRDRKPLKIDRIMECARVCRVENTIRPYLEGML